MEKEERERWKLRLVVIELSLLIILLLIIRPAFTGNVVDGTTCKSSWQPCPNGDSDCCAGLSCQGGTCKTALTTEIPSTEDSSSVAQITCNNSGQTCEKDADCCDGLSCPEGICKERLDTCIDSDGGKNPYLKGRTSGLNEKEVYSSFLADNCTPTNKEVEEFYCENEIVNSEIIPCLNDCENGMCSCKFSGQSCSSSLECCSGFNCIDKICTSQTGEIPPLLKNKFLCTFVGYSCELDEDCCSKNCRPDWVFFFWKSDSRKCSFAKIE